MIVVGEYLGSISLGPVQDFVQAARRTRDLWFGSHFLSEVSKRVAESLVADSAELIFPHPDSLRGTQAISNKILAVVEADSVRHVVKRARDAALTYLRRIAKDTLQKLQDGLPPSRDVVDEDLFFRQVDDFLEFYAAWVPVTGVYERDRKRVEALLAARKTVRNFEPNPGKPVVKSSLDGARESVMRVYPGDEILERRLRSKGIRVGEALDAMGLIKPLSVHRPYPSVVRVAVDSWIRAGLLDESFRAQLRRTSDVLQMVADKVPEADVVSRMAEFHTAASHVPSDYQEFPYDGKVLLEGFFEQEEFKQLAARDGELARVLKDEVTRLQKLRPHAPHPYLAVLMADGDRMGVQIDRMQRVENHKDFSARVSEFARRAQDVIVEHHGVPVYAGGDDVLAFLPLETCLQAADALRTLFESLVGTIATQDKPSLSVGIAIGYCREDLGYLRQLAQQAEHEAKEPDRNGLCVWVQTRSGGDPIRVRCRWDEDPVPRMERLVTWHQKAEVAHATGYALEGVARLYGRKASKDIVAGELRRALRRRTLPGERQLADEVVKEIESLFASRLQAHEAHAGDAMAALEVCASWLKLGHWFASHTEPAIWNSRGRAHEEVGT